MEQEFQNQIKYAKNFGVWLIKMKYALISEMKILIGMSSEGKRAWILSNYGYFNSNV